MYIGLQLKYVHANRSTHMPKTLNSNSYLAKEKGVDFGEAWL